jgi:hypothetical protein
MSDGIKVGRELDARELQLQHLRHGVNEQRLGQTGRADDQAVAAHEQRVQHLTDDVFLTDDDLAQLADNLLAARSHSVRKLDVVRRLEIDDVAGIRIHRYAITHLAPSRLLISRVFSARSVTSFSSSLWYFAGSMLSLSSPQRLDAVLQLALLEDERAQLRVGRQRRRIGRGPNREQRRHLAIGHRWSSAPRCPALSPLSSSIACSVDSSPSFS